jgi:hypothetical protein
VQAKKRWHSLKRYAAIFAGSSPGVTVSARAGAEPDFVNFAKQIGGDTLAQCQVRLIHWSAFSCASPCKD